MTETLAANELAVTADATSENEKLLRAQADDYAKAFASGNYKAMANMWLAEGSLTNIDGVVLQGRPAIESYFKSYFENNDQQNLEIVVDSIKLFSSDLAIEEGHSRLLKGPFMDIVTHYSVVHLKVNDKWQMYSVIETPDENSCIGSLSDWEWLIGDWSAHISQTKSLNIKASWAIGQKFIRCLFETDNANGKEFAMLVLGQDPSSGRIISWHFDPSGGFGSGKWTKDGQTWIEKATSVESNGIKGNAFYILHRIDNNSFTWRSAQRILGKSQLPDTEEITIARQ